MSLLRRRREGSEAMSTRNPRHGGGVAGEWWGPETTDLAGGDEVAEGGEVGAVLLAVHGRRDSPESASVRGGGEEEWGIENEGSPERERAARERDRE